MHIIIKHMISIRYYRTHFCTTLQAKFADLRQHRSNVHCPERETQTSEQMVKSLWVQVIVD